MEPGKSLLACRACRRLKRKCTRELPVCSLCQRLSKRCHYPGRNQISDSDEPPTSSAESASPIQLSAALIRSREEFPTSFFLDPAFFHPLPAAAFVFSSGPFESQIKACVGSDVDSVSQRYFSTVHKWLPILSKKRLMNLLNIPSSPGDGSQLLLLLCMKLATNSNHCDGLARDSSLYQLAKLSCSASEHGCFISFRLVQCLVLIATYELGHAIFPEAYMTIGQASRLGGMIGLHNKTVAQQLFMAADTWTYREEQRRTWWAIFLFDKYVSIGTRFIPPSVSEPCLDVLLPVNDIDWNQGLISPSEPLLTTSFHSVADLGIFARTCQAAHILDKVLRHRDHRTHSGQENEAVMAEALALHGALVALEASLAPQCVFLDRPDRGQSNGDAPPPTRPMHSPVTDSPSTEVGNVLALSLSASARLLLYKIYSFNEPETGYGRGRTALETEMQRLSLAGIWDLSMRLAPGLAGVVVSGAAASPLLSSLSYHVATECARLIREDYDSKTRQALGEIVDGLRQLATKWRVAGEYLALLERGGVLGLIPDE